MDQNLRSRVTEVDEMKKWMMPVTLECKAVEGGVNGLGEGKEILDVGIGGGADSTVHSAVSG